MASNDVRDILDVAPSTQPRPAKKAKVAAAKNQYAGMSKEVRGLMMGDGIAPVQVQEIQYKKKPKLAKRAQPWVREPFTNSARSDGLVLKHWWKSTVPHRLETPGSHGAPATPAESKVENDTDAKPAPAIQTNYPFARFNTRPNVPEYDDAQYEANLTHSDWTKDETDYLISMAGDFDLRWLVIWDRYEYKPPESQEDGDGATTTQVAKQRSMEDLKARYYFVAAKMMEIHHPLSSMSTTEFDIHEKMLKFDPNREATRKKLAEALLARSPEELREEEILLGELKRIVDNEERFLEERKDLYRRLDFPLSHGSISGYETSAGLQQLALTLASQERSKKQQRRSLNEAGGNATGPATSGHRDGAGAGTGRGEQRPAATGKPTKKGAAAAAAAQRRQLSARDEIRYGISHHDRLSSGVSFRQGRIEKLVLAKSAAQAQKLHDALGELQIPVRAVMPTDRVCTRYENLIREIHLLLDARKTSEKVNNELKVLRQQKAARERKERGDVGGESQDEKDNSRMDLDGANDAEGESSKAAAEGNHGTDDQHDATGNGGGGGKGADADAQDKDSDDDKDDALSEDGDEDDDEENKGDGDEDDADAEVDDDDEHDDDNQADVDEDEDQDEDAEHAEGSDAEVAEEDDDDREDNGEEEDENGELDLDDEDGDGEGEDGEEVGEEEDEQENAEVQEDEDAEIDEGEDEEDNGEAAENGVDEDGEEPADATGAVDDDADENADAEAEAEAAKAHKRSASVLSANSTRSSKRTRR